MTHTLNEVSYRARRFFWWCAGADASVLDAPDGVRLDGIKYAAVGALVCLTTTVAACSWAHNAAVMLADKPGGIALALGLGALMGTLVFCMERVLIVSIRQDAPVWGRAAGLAWRGVIASLSAALVTTPFALAYFDNGILARLDAEKLALMSEKRQQIDGMYKLKEGAAAIAGFDRDLAANREEREALTPALKQLAEAAAVCERERGTLQTATDAKIASANTRIGQLRRQIAEYPYAASYLRRRITAYGARITEWRNTLAAKAQACHEVIQQFAAARQAHRARLDQEWQEEAARKNAAQQTLDRSRREAGVLLGQSDEVVTKATAPDLSARLHALGRMAAEDRFVAAVLLLAYCFFVLVEIMPVIAKLVMRSAYDRRMTVLYRRATAEAETDATLAEADAAIRAEIARAERVGMERLLRQAGNEAALDLARVRAETEVSKAEIAAPFAQVNTLVETLAATQSRVDGYAGRAELAAHIEAMRSVLTDALRRATAAAGTAHSRAV